MPHRQSNPDAVRRMLDIISARKQELKLRLAYAGLYVNANFDEWDAELLREELLDEFRNKIEALDVLEEILEAA